MNIGENIEYLNGVWGSWGHCISTKK